ncbi:uncharacterized protein EV420DRAFT_1532669 [Desarmillaria tabescens]|uniref:Uncharacterized protein n=1 Tax=Armillaria tabescens TaxID=1929756 RepID=A0AA39N7M5_ARMTA|nr:uncharacterized protein EV420DRAFT_1532669 [Desarmillaria tabescens]KAK0460524.1 hypothetical protein EV420DRAFT_1532669 [Desarmillaria tabescens]
MSLHADYSRYPSESFPDRLIGTKLNRSPDSDEFVSTQSWSLLSHSSRASSVTLSPLSDSNQASSLPLSLPSDSNQMLPAPVLLPYSDQTSLSLPYLPSDSTQASSSSPILLSDSNQTSSSPVIASTTVPKRVVHASSLSTGFRWILMILMFTIARAGFEVLLRRYCTHVFPLSYL